MVLVSSVFISFFDPSTLSGRIGCKAHRKQDKFKIIYDRDEWYISIVSLNILIYIYVYILWVFISSYYYLNTYIYNNINKYQHLFQALDKLFLFNHSVIVINTNINTNTNTIRPRRVRKVGGRRRIIGYSAATSGIARFNLGSGSIRATDDNDYDYKR